MKKVLFATSALVATASVAAADVTFSGYGRFGLQHQEDRNIDPNTGALWVPPAGNPLNKDTIIESRFRLNIDASTESDAGVTFGARLRIEANEAGGAGAAGAGTFNGARFHAETGGFRLEVGNIAHALDNLSNYYGTEPGLVGQIGQYSNYRGPITGYSGGGTGVNGVSAIYSVGDFRAQLSYDDDTDGVATGDVETVSASVAYTFSGWTAALGYESSDDGAGAVTSDLDGVVLTVGGSLGVADVAFFIADSDGFDTSYGISGRFDVGAATAITAAISAGGDADVIRGAGFLADDLSTAYAVGFDHDLGGGVALRGMVGRDNVKRTRADLGVVFNF